MKQAVVDRTSLQTILIVCAFGLITTACSSGKPFDYHEIDAIGQGPGFFTGDAGEATYDPVSGELEMGNSTALSKQNQRSSEIRRRRARARRRQEGATGN